jgi:hypothetical protein
MKVVAKSGSLAVLASVLLVVAWTRAGADVTITTCGQSVPARETGTLVADLTCSSSATAVFVGDRATLDLDTHAIAGEVQCVRSCTIIGPGEVGGSSASAIVVNTRAGAGTKFVARDLTVRNSRVGIFSQALQTNLFTNVTATQNSEAGILVFGRAKGTNVTVTDNGGSGFISQRKSVRFVGLTATGNGAAGLLNNGGRTRLVDSTLTGNTYPPFPGTPTLLDLFSFGRPKLVNTTCEHSLGPRGEPWGVCSLD